METKPLDPQAVADGVHDAFLTVLTTGLGFGPDYPFSREDLLAAVTEGVRQAFAEASRSGDSAICSENTSNPMDREGRQ